MIIKLIPENDFEKQKFRDKFGADKIEHKGVREYLIFGNKVEGARDILDFHEWVGSYRYLMSGLYYFQEIINDERKSGISSAIPTVVQNEPLTILNPEDNAVPIEPVAENTPKLIKRGVISDPNIVPIDIRNISRPKIVKMNPEDLQEKPRVVNARPSPVVNKNEDEEFVDMEPPTPPSPPAFPDEDENENNLEKERENWAKEVKKGLRIIPNE